MVNIKMLKRKTPMTAQLVCYIPLATKARLKEIADRYGLTMSETMRQLIENYQDEDKRNDYNEDPEKTP